MSKWDHPSNWGRESGEYDYTNSPQFKWFNKRSAPYDQDVESLREVSRVMIQHNHDLEMIKALLTTILNTLDRHRELLDNQMDVLDLIYDLGDLDDYDE